MAIILNGNETGIKLLTNTVMLLNTEWYKSCFYSMKEITSQMRYNLQVNQIMSFSLENEFVSKYRYIYAKEIIKKKTDLVMSSGSLNT